MGKVINLLEKRGKIFISDIDNYNNIDAHLYLFCKTYSDAVPDGTILADQLAPSFELCIMKCSWIENGVLGEHYNDFAEKYINEIHTRADYISALKNLKELVIRGKTIVLFDDCRLGNLCHLNILKNELLSMGFRVYSVDKSSYNLVRRK